MVNERLGHALKWCEEYKKEYEYIKPAEPDIRDRIKEAIREIEAKRKWRSKHYQSYITGMEKAFVSLYVIEKNVIDSALLEKFEEIGFREIEIEAYPEEWNEELKESIRKRDNYTCQICGMTQEESLIRYKGKLSIHHIDRNKNNCNPDNLVTQCKGCHHNKKMYFI